MDMSPFKQTQTKSSEIHLLCCCGTKHIHYRVHLQAFIVNLAVALVFSQFKYYLVD